MYTIILTIIGTAFVCILINTLTAHGKDIDTLSEHSVNHTESLTYHMNEINRVWSDNAQLSKRIKALEDREKSK